MTKNIVIIDTNIIRNMNFEILSNYIDKIKTNIGEPFLHEIVLDEMMIYHKNKFVSEIIQVINSNEIYSNILNFQLSEEILIERLINAIKEEYLKSFNYNLINRVRLDVEEIYRMAINKTPPFIADQGNSDKGFKDTLIWLGLKNIQDANVFLLTRDKAFLNNSEYFKKEFFNNTKHDLVILQEIPEKNQNKKITETVLSVKDSTQEKSVNKNIIDEFRRIEEFRTIINNILEDIVYTEDSNPYSYSNVVKRFTIYQKIEYIDINILIQRMNDFIKENIFNSYCSTELFLEKLFGIELVDSNFKYPIELVVKFLDTLNKYKDDFKDYSDYVSKTIIDFINNNTYEEKKDFLPIDSNDLPF